MQKFVARCAVLALITGVSAVTGLTGCNSSRHAATATAICSAGIVNGFNLASTTPVGASTVFIEIESTTHEFFGCTGTLIGRQLVLTAQHCVDGASKISVVFSDAGLTPDQELGGPAIMSDNWAKYTPAGHVTPHDLAIVHLPTPAPYRYVVQSLPSATYNVEGASKLTAAGYGITSECASDDGALRATIFSSSELLQTGLIHQGGTSFYYEEPGMLMIDQSKTGICSGDSGGPLYAESGGRLQLVGVTSYTVDSSDETNYAHICHGLGLFTDLRQNLDWIASASAQLSAGVSSN